MTLKGGEMNRGENIGENGEKRIEGYRKERIKRVKVEGGEN